MQQLELQFMQPVLGHLPFGKIADETGEMPLAADHRLAHRQFDRKGAAILALADDDAADADDAPLPGLEIVLEVTVMTLVIGRRHEDADVPADGFCGGVAEQALGGRAEGFDQPAFVDDENGVRRGLQDRAQARLALTQHFVGYRRIMLVRHPCPLTANCSIDRTHKEGG